MKLQFHPGTNMSQAMSETVAQVNRAFVPANTAAPFIVRFDAGGVAVGYLVFSTDNPNRTLGEMQDQALNRVRPAFAALRALSASPSLRAAAPATSSSTSTPRACAPTASRPTKSLRR